MIQGLVKPVELPTLAEKESSSGAAALGERHDLIEHLEVVVTVTIGSACMSVGDLFAMAPGTVVTLDRDADAPLDVRINGKLIARGILVAAGDKFGIRLTEILEERP